MPWVVLAFFVFVVVLLAGADDTRQALLATPRVVHRARHRLGDRASSLPQ